MYVFRGRRGDLIQIIWWDGQGAWLFRKRPETGRFVWPSAKAGQIALTPARLAMLPEGYRLAAAPTWLDAAEGGVNRLDRVCGDFSGRTDRV